ncbi:MAG: acyl-CoA mutase large subunit family protein [Promethearchaeota archaeon]|jgi:methylmalonyl-CoA mutase N-terminal domain/subunit
MIKRYYRDKIDKTLKQWQNDIGEEILRDERYTEDGILLKPIYTPLDINEDFDDEISFPGKFPFTRGIEATGYRKDLWKLSQYAGFGNQKETNKLFKNMITHGNDPYLALDLPTQLGYDSDHPFAKGEVGRAGTPVNSLKDWETIFDGINLGSAYVGTVANAQAAIILAMHLALAEKQKVNLIKLRGSLQNDILKEYTVRGNYIFPIEPSLRLVTDVVEYCSKKLPSYWPICVCGGHFSEAGSNRIHEVAFSLGNAFTYIDQFLKRGLLIDDFAKSIFFLMKSNHTDFFEEIAKFRAMRKIWAKTLKEKYNSTEIESMKLKILGHSGGSLLTRERPELNIARTTLACLAGALGGIQLIGLRTMDEVFGIPTEKSEMIAIGSQQVVAHETGVPDVVDPLGGSYYIESLTEKFSNRILEELKHIENIGGMIKAIESGYIKRTIAEDAYQSHQNVDSGKKIKVGVNKYRVEDKEQPRTPYKLNPKEEIAQKEGLYKLKMNRDNSLVERKLKNIKEMASKPVGSKSNLIPSIIEAVKSYATMGEICDALRDIFGEYKEPSIF